MDILEKKSSGKYKWKKSKFKFLFYGNNEKLLIVINKEFDDIWEAFDWADQYVKDHGLDNYQIYLRLYRRKKGVRNNGK